MKVITLTREQYAIAQLFLQGVMVKQCARYPEFQSTDARTIAEFIPKNMLSLDVMLRGESLDDYRRIAEHTRAAVEETYAFITKYLVIENKEGNPSCQSQSKK